ncbi:histidine phosphatase family protein [Actinomyces bowdenii]|uniref:histidine phosphatase family protein n=1 Tax=Actinomyces bowdenii TaxID=131109 RepID=UPI0016397533|nr:histidine phosphatase family protein [Actinomyces bowdenii]MBO3723939.1 histidine phosphatase family protein [Actinomyces bowdenii]
MTDLVLWRHGQTDYNRQKRVQGRIDIPLNEEGLAQAAAVAPALEALGPRRIVSSPLQRARGTARILADRCGIEVGIDDDLAERSFGQWEGLTRREIKAGWPEQYRRWRTGEEPEGVGVEARADVAERVGAALARLAQGAREGEVTVVACHGSALTVGACRLLGLDPSAWFGLRGLDNSHYAVLRRSRREPGWTLVAWNLG